MSSVKSGRPATNTSLMVIESQMQAERLATEGDDSPDTALSADRGDDRLWSLRDALATHESAEASRFHSRPANGANESSWEHPVQPLEVEPEMTDGWSEADFERLVDGIDALPAPEMACLHLLGFDAPKATATTAGGLARTLARRGRSVLLIDGDLELGGLSGGAGQCQRAGLIEILNRSTLWRQALYPTSCDGLMFLPVGRGVLSQAGNDAARWGTLLQDCSSRFSHVVVSGRWGPDSVAVGCACSRTIPVIQLGITPIAAVERAVRTLCRAGVTTSAGIVID